MKPSTGSVPLTLQLLESAPDVLKSNSCYQIANGCLVDERGMLPSDLERVFSLLDRGGILFYWKSYSSFSRLI
jgi:hypothetical protein